MAEYALAKVRALADDALKLSDKFKEAKHRLMKSYAETQEPGLSDVIVHLGLVVEGLDKFIIFEAGLKKKT